MDFPPQLLQLLLNRLPPLPLDEKPGASWSATSVRRVLNSLATDLTTMGALPGVLTPALTTYLERASDQQLAWLVQQIGEMTDTLRLAQAQDDAPDAAQLALLPGPG